MSKKNKPDTNGCIGLCCSMFNLLGESKEDYLIEGIDNEECRQVGEMLRLIGYDTENSTDGKPWPVYTCKYWNKNTKLCTIYDQRPEMCRTYPDGDECGWEGCTVGKDTNV